MNNRDVFEIDEKRYEELVKIAKAQLDYEKKELLESGGNEDDYFFTYRICPNNEESPFCLYILGLSSYKEMSTEELKLQIDEFTEELEDLQLEFFTITKAVIDAFITGSACAVSVYTGKTAIQKRMRSNDKNN